MFIWKCLGYLNVSFPFGLGFKGGRLHRNNIDLWWRAEGGKMLVNSCKGEFESTVHLSIRCGSIRALLLGPDIFTKGHVLHSTQMYQMSCIETPLGPPPLFKKTDGKIRKKLSFCFRSTEVIFSQFASRAQSLMSSDAMVQTACSNVIIYIILGFWVKVHGSWSCCWMWGWDCSGVWYV